MFGPGVVSHMCFVACLVASAGLVCVRRRGPGRVEVRTRSAVEVTVAIAAFVIGSISPAYGVPETWWPTAFSLSGGASGDRFGAQISCSLGVSNRSYIAVGAPGAVNGSGRVYLYDADAPTSASQVLSAPVPVDNQHFGTAVQFVDDFNGDNIDELAIGQPGDGTSGGAVYIFQSSASGGAVTWTYCGTNPGEPGAGFGGVLQAMRNTFDPAIPDIVVGGGAQVDATYGFTLSASGAVCSMGAGTTYTITSHLGTAVGQCIAEAPDLPVSSDGEPELLVCEPLHTDGMLTNEGRLTYATSSLNNYGMMLDGQAGEEVGYSLASHYSATHYAYGKKTVPGGEPRVVFNSFSSPDSCSIVHPEPSGAVAFGDTLSYLGILGDALFGPQNSIYAVSRSEPTTGGAVSIVGVTTNSCTSQYQYNNCQSDSLQEQGAAIAGNGLCGRHAGLGTESLMLVGSPGFDSQRGRVDVVADGSDYGSAQPCDVPTNTPTPTSTPTPQGGDPATATPTPTPTPVVIAPGQKNLPPPQVQVVGDDISVTMPQVTPRLTGKALTKAMKLLMARGLTKQQATKALKSLVVTYVLKISNVGGASVSEVDVFGRSTIIRSRNNQISRQNLAPGNYSTTYTVQISTKKPSVPLGSTGSSQSTTFRVQ